MCDPISIAVGGLFIAGEIDKHIKGNQEAAANKLNAEKAFRDDNSALIARLTEERIVAGLELSDLERQGASLTSTSAVAAAEAGVGGISVEAIAGDVERQVAEESTIINRGLRDTERQLERERDAAESRRAGRIAGVPGSNTVATVLGVGAGVLRGVRSHEGRKL